MFDGGVFKMKPKFERWLCCFTQKSNY